MKGSLGCGSEEAVPEDGAVLLAAAVLGVGKDGIDGGGKVAMAVELADEEIPVKPVGVGKAGADATSVGPG